MPQVHEYRPRGLSLSGPTVARELFDTAALLEALDEPLAVARQAEYGEPALGACDQTRRGRFFGTSAGEAGATATRWRVAHGTAAHDEV